MKKDFLLFFFLLLAFSAKAQQYNIRHYSVQDGLPSGLITEIFQDSRGFLWIGSDAGISRYDGRHFVNYSFSDGLKYNFITDIREDDDGHLWFGNGPALAHFDGHSFHTREIRIKERPVDIRKIMPITSDQSLATSREGLWLVGPDTNILYTEADGLLHKNCFSFLKTRSGRILFCSKGGINEWKDGKIIPYLKTENPSNVVITMAEDAEGYIWMGMLHNEVKRFDPANPEKTQKKVVIPNQNESFIAAFVSSDKDYVYLGGQRNVHRFKNGKYLESTPTVLSRESDVLNEIYNDREGNIWVGSQYGLWRVSQGFAYPLKADSILGGAIYDIHVLGEDSVLFTDGYYMHLVVNNKVQAVMKDKPLQMSEINDFFVSKSGHIYFGSTLTGLMVRTPKGEYKTLPMQRGMFQRCFSITEDSKGTIYMGSNNALYRLHPDSAEAMVFAELMYVNLLHIDCDSKDRIWMGSNNGLYLFDNGKLTNYPDSVFDKHWVIERVFADDTLLYVGTKGQGLFCYSIAGDSPVLLKTLTVADGLPSNYITFIQKDQKNQLWVASKRGLSKVVNFFSKKAFVRNYSSDDGIPNTFWDKASVGISPKGIVWIGTASGPMRIQPNREFTSEYLPQIYLLDAQASQGQYKFSPKRLIPPTYEGEIPFENNDFTFYFTSLQLSNAENMEFWYKLEGRSEEWIQAPSNGLLTLNNLLPGQYTLWIKAFDPNRQLYSQETSYSFKIRRPFWMSGWFYFLLFLAAVSLLYLIFRWRVNVNYRKNHEKLLINRQLSESRYLAFQARMNPHFIFNSLNSIQYFITQNDKKSSLTYLSKFARLLRQILDNSKALKIPLKEEVEILNSYVEMESMRFDNHFSYEFDIDPVLDQNNLEIPGMILQPFVENAIVHGLLHQNSGEGKLLVQMRQDGNFVECIVEDNGVGREKSAEINSKRKANHKSYGMEIASNRLMLLAEDHDLGELIKIEDLHEPSGTRVTIKLPIV
ncbi:MAG: hypothetical protein EP332_05335 [Bacteroidetes bacterium]|nr:MAG: hypothetical protein EP332_05335 [Bacteroidota bacterium]